MAFSEEDHELIEAFRTYIEDSVENDDRYGACNRLDRNDASTLAMRFEVTPTCWFEVALRPVIPQIRVAFLTNDRWLSEELEQAIQDSGDSMEKFVGVGMNEAGLDWDEPPVEHYHDGGEFFYFATPLSIDELPDLERDQVRNKVLRMLEGYLIAFGPALTEDEEA